MEEQITNIVEIIKDYRSDSITIDYDHVLNWVNQFDEPDREFLITELLNILPDSYISRDYAIQKLDGLFEILRTNYGYNNINEFLEHCCFLSCQGDLKSQTILLGFMDELLISKYGRSVNDCGNNEIRYWIYLDDVLASGGTFRKEIKKEIDDFGTEEFFASPIQIISVFFFLHCWGQANSIFVLQKNTGFDIKNKLDFFRVGAIDNNPRIHHNHNPNPRLNHVWPKECDNGKEFLEYLENAFERDYPLSKEQFAFRKEELPQVESFYTSSENRDRYESIILQKGIEIIQSLDNLVVPSTRPLGFTPPSYKTLGTGSHSFTWRNVSNTCPLVYWYETPTWNPLFPVQNRGN